MTNETILKEILRGDPQLPAELLDAVARNGGQIGPQLLELIRNVRLWHTEEAGHWAVLHAIRLVSRLEVRNAVPALIDAIFLAFGTRHEEALEDLPAALARTGESAIPALVSVLEDPALEPTVRTVAASALEGIAVLYPETRDRILEDMRKIIADIRDVGSVRAHVVGIVAHFRIPEDRKLIRNAAHTTPMMLDMDAGEIDEYFNQSDEPETWGAYRGNLLEYYQ